MATIKTEMFPEEEPATTSGLVDDPTFQPKRTSTPNPHDGHAPLYSGGDDHWTHFATSMRALRSDRLLTDYTIIAGDEKFPAHCAVLAAFSGVVRARALAGDDAVLDLRNLNPRVVTPLLDFIYEGEARVEAGLVEELLAVAERLEVFGLVAKAKVDPSEEEDAPKVKKRKRKNGPGKKTSASSSTSSPAVPEKKRKVTAEIERFEKKDIEFIKSDDGKQFVCNYCYADFGSSSGVSLHVKLHTGQAKKFACFRCDFEALQKSNLKTHCAKKHGINGKVFDTIMKQKTAPTDDNNNEVKGEVADDDIDDDTGFDTKAEEMDSVGGEGDLGMTIKEEQI